MCGLVGVYSSNMMMKHKNVLSDMLYLDTFRGKDSTGVAAIRHNADTAVLKSTVPGYEFVEGPKLEQHLKLNDFCWIGHNRFGTMGKNIKTNAHPFTIDDDDGGCLLVGAHNGTLKNKYALTDASKFGTDSEALFSEIAFYGLEDAIKKVEGAWALTYYDHNEEELRIIRNKERTLFYAFEEGKKTLIWASEMWMIRVACSRHDVKLQDDKVYAFAEDTLYRFPAPMKMNEEIGMERKGGIVGKEASTFFQNGNRERRAGGTNWRPHPTTHTQGAATRPSSSTSSSSSAIAASTTQSGTTEQSNGEKLAQTSASSSDGASSTTLDKIRDILSAKKYKGYQGILITKEELDDQLENGCGWCELEFITKEDKFAWLAPGKPVCHKCLTGVHEPDKKTAQVVCH